MRKKNNDYMENKVFLVIRIVITVVSFIIMVKYASRLSLWVDDLGTIHIVEPGQSLSTILNRYAPDSGTNAPLFFIPAYFWIRIVPYGTVWLKLLNILFVSLGIWFCGIGAKRICGDRAAVFATIFAATSTFVVTHAALTFRCYGLVFLLCSLLIPAYFNWLTNRNKISSNFKFCIIIIAMLYTHFFATLTVGVIAVYDLWLLFRKKATWKILIPYGIAALVFVPYFFTVFRKIQSNIQGFWGSVPNLSNLINLLSNIFSNSGLASSLFSFGVIILLFGRYIKVTKKDSNYFLPSHDTMGLLAFWIMFVVLFIYIYSRYVHPQASVFVSRYFSVCVAPAVVFCGVCLDWLLTALCDGKSHASIALLQIAVISFSYMSGLAVELKSLNNFPGTMNEPYEQALDWVYERPDALSESTLVCYPPAAIEGGLRYYATHNGQRQNLNLGFLSEDSWMNITTVYQLPMHGNGNLPNEMQNILNEHYMEIERNDALHVVVYSQIQSEDTPENNEST